MTQVRRAAVYCRISKDRVGAGLGVERQEADCRELAARLGWTVVEVFPDNDLSAFTGKRRPSYRRMLDAIRDGRVDAVLAWHTDRLHRSPVELEEYISACQPGEVPTHCVTAGVLDLSTASGRMTARITGAVARHESEHMSERICGQKARATAAGQWTGGGRPFGYTRDGMALVATEADAIRDGVHRVLAGESVYSITKSWQATVTPVRGGRWHAQNVSRILTRPRNAKLAAHHGEVVGAGEWPSIITEDEHHAVCAIVRDPARSTYSGVRSLKWVGSGLYRCGRCGADMRSASNMTRDGHTRRVYRCRTGMHLMISGEKLDEFVTETVCALLDQHGPGLLPARDVDATRELHSQANALRARLDELADAYGDGDLDRRQYTRQRERITAKLDTLTGQLAAAQSGGALDGIATAERPATAFRAQPVARRRAIVDALMTVTVQPAKPGRLPKGVDFAYDRVLIEPREIR
ncbi:MAG: recombinase family protein [Pseudonocardiales bacterium]|nr:MAG: recombinase family protein [Pseudonocardiales bacterium]